MQPNKFPFKYYVLLFIMLLLAILFWVIVFGLNKNETNIQHYNTSRTVERVFVNDPRTEIEYWQQEYLPEQTAQVITIDTTKIINDTLNRRRIVSNLVNIALKNSTSSIAKFANELKQKYT